MGCGGGAFSRTGAVATSVILARAGASATEGSTFGRTTARRGAADPPPTASRRLSDGPSELGRTRPGQRRHLHRTPETLRQKSPKTEALPAPRSRRARHAGRPGRRPPSIRRTRLQMCRDSRPLPPIGRDGWCQFALEHSQGRGRRLSPVRSVRTKRSSRSRQKVVAGSLRAGGALRPLTRFAPKGPPRAVLLRSRALRRPRCGPTPVASLRGRASARRASAPARSPAAARHVPAAGPSVGPLRCARGVPNRGEDRHERSEVLRRALWLRAGDSQRKATALARRRASRRPGPRAKRRGPGRSEVAAAHVRGGGHRAEWSSEPPGEDGRGARCPHGANQCHSLRSAMRLLRVGPSMGVESL